MGRVPWIPALHFSWDRGIWALEYSDSAGKVTAIPAPLGPMIDHVGLSRAQLVFQFESKILVGLLGPSRVTWCKLMQLPKVSDETRSPSVLRMNLIQKERDF